MNKFIFNFAVVLLLTACHSEKRPADISGTWHWNDEDTGADFTLTLTQNDRELTGFYCGIYNHGSRIDCPMEEENNVSGIFEEGVWKIDYVSNYSMNSGEAILEYGEKGGDLIWINKTLNSGAFCPDSVALVRND